MSRRSGIALAVLALGAIAIGSVFVSNEPTSGVIAAGEVSDQEASSSCQVDTESRTPQQQPSGTPDQQSASPPSDSGVPGTQDSGDAPTRAERRAALERQRAASIEQARTSLGKMSVEKITATISFEGSISRPRAVEILESEGVTPMGFVYGMAGQNSFWTVQQPTGAPPDSPTSSSDESVRGQLEELVREAENLVSNAPSNDAAHVALSDARELLDTATSPQGLPVVAAYAETSISSARQLAGDPSIAAVGAVGRGCSPQRPVIPPEAVDSFGNATNAEATHEEAPHLPNPTPEIADR